MSRVLRNNKSVKFLGPAGSGKSTEIYEFANQIAQGNIPGIPRTAEVQNFSLVSFTAGTSLRGSSETKLSEVLAYSRWRRPVLVADEFHSIVGVGAHSKDSTNILQKMKPALEEGEIRIIGISTEQEWNLALGSDPAANQRFQKVLHDPPKGDELLAILERAMKKKTGFVPERSVLAAAIRFSDELAISGAQPRAAVNLLLT